MGGGWTIREWLASEIAELEDARSAEMRPDLRRKNPQYVMPRNSAARRAVKEIETRLDVLKSALKAVDEWRKDRDRRIRRRQMRKAIAMAPGEFLEEVEQLQRANEALHTANKAMLHVMAAARALLGRKVDDLAARVNLGNAVEHAESVIDGIMSGTVVGMPPKEGFE